MDFKIICDTREMVGAGKLRESLYSDHPSEANLESFIRAATNQGFAVSFFGGVESIVESVASGEKFSDSVFINFSDGLTHTYSRVQVPVLCELLGVPYSGSGVFSSAVVNNKRCACSLVGDAAINVPGGMRITSATDINRTFLGQLLPVFVKPNCEGSSMGISLDSYQPTLEGALRLISNLLRDYEELSVEHFIDGRDVTVFVLGNPPNFEVVEPIVLQAEGRSFLDLEAKKNRLVERRDARQCLSSEEIDEVRRLSRRIFEVLDCRDICRIDFKMTKNGDFFFIEANSAPRFSETSEIGFLAKCHERRFDDYVGLFLNTVKKRLNHGEV